MKNITLIASLRRQEGWTQEVLAEKCGLSVRTIQRLESGEDGNLETLKIISQTLEVKVSDLFESIGNQDKENIISSYDKAQGEQIHQRKQSRHLWYITYQIFILLMIIVSVFDHSSTFWLCWTFLWPIGFILLNTIKTIWLEPKWDQKYPLTKGVNLK